jgi:hypothetical protein
VSLSTKLPSLVETTCPLTNPEIGATATAAPQVVRAATATTPRVRSR